MKGIVFAEFLDFVDQQFSIDQTQTMIDACELESSGAYTSVGTYDHHEMVQLLMALSKQSGIEAGKLLHDFGFHLMGVFASKFGEFVNRANDLFSFLASVEDHIHVEVRKLYPDAELPQFTTVSMTESEMVMDYRSKRCLSALAEGLMMGAAKHFETPITISRASRNEESETVVRFTLCLEQTE